VKASVRAATLVVIGILVLVVAASVVALVLFKAGETSSPPRTIPVTTTTQG
jgi:hypothetical protein